MKTRSKRGPKGPALTAGHWALWLASGAIGAFGIMGWIDGADTLASKILLGAAAGFAAVVVPATVHHIGRGWVSLLLVLVALPFLAITAASTHNAWGVLVEDQRLAAATADEAADVATAKDKLDKADMALAGVKLVKPTCTCPRTIKETTDAWERERAPYVADVATRKADLSAAMARLDAARAAHHPMASDLAVWVVGSSIDVAIALGLAVLSVIVRRKPDMGKPGRKAKSIPKAKKQPAKAKATAPRGDPNWKPVVVQPTAS